MSSAEIPFDSWWGQGVLQPDQEWMESWNGRHFRQRSPVHDADTEGSWGNSLEDSDGFEQHLTGKFLPGLLDTFPSTRLHKPFDDPGQQVFHRRQFWCQLKPGGQIPPCVQP